MKLIESKFFIGKKFNKLTIQETFYNKKHRSIYCNCLCDCGNLSQPQLRYVKSGYTKSCGCIPKTIVHKRKIVLKTSDDIQQKRGSFQFINTYDLNIKRFIYILININTNKIYIGKCERTLKLHLLRYQSNNKRCYIENSIRKHSLNNFIFDILEIVNINVDINKREIFWIKELNSNDNKIGYNLTIGGDGIIGRKVSIITKQRISKSRLGKFEGKDNPFYGKTHSIETKNKIIESNKRRTGTKNRRKNETVSNNTKNI